MQRVLKIFGNYTYYDDDDENEDDEAHVHVGVLVEEVEATCIDTGVKEYYECECGASFENINCENEIIDFELWQETDGKIDVEDHTYKPTTSKKATVSTDGTKLLKCSLCGKAKTEKIYKVKTIKLIATEYTYDGKTKKPSVIIKDSKGNVIPKNNYTLTYASGRKSVGEYKVTVKFKGDYSGSKSLTFKIIPKTTSVSNVKSDAKKLEVTVKKYSTQTTGYEVQIAADKLFTKGVKKADIRKNSTTKATFKSIKAKTIYYVRVRTYKTVSGKKIYSDWSKVKSIKTK